MKKVVFVFNFLVVLLGNLYAADVPDSASRVYVVGKQLMFEKRLADGTLDVSCPYTIAGVTWSPVSRAPAVGPDPDDPSQTTQYGFFYDWSGHNGAKILDYWMRNQFEISYVTDISLMNQMKVNTVRTYKDFFVDDDAQKYILDEYYRKGIMVIMTVAISKAEMDAKRYLDVVRAYKDHPAILMWLLGNEWNLDGNKYYGYSTVAQAATATNLAAQEIKAIDLNHPVSSSLGDRFTDSNSQNTIAAVIAACPDVDIWGLNIYRGITFGELFTQWQAITSKPMYLSEFGTDSFHTASFTFVSPNKADECQGVEDREQQKTVDSGLWTEIKNNFSAVNADKICVGGIIHEFNDELWKVGCYHAGLGGIGTGGNGYELYSSEGFYISGGHPDNVANDEYFGVVDADRNTKSVFFEFQNRYAEIDVTPPLKPTVYDEGSYTQSVSQLVFGWSSSDQESGIDEYQYRLVPSGEWISTGTNTSVTMNGLNLTQGSSYSCEVRVKNGIGFWSAIGCSDGIIVDTTAPVIPQVNDDGVTTHVYDQLHASWVSSDQESGVVEYQYALGTTQGATDVCTWTSVGTATSVTVTGLNLFVGQQYYFSVKVRNGVGLESMGYSDGILVSNNTPVFDVLEDKTGKENEQLQFIVNATDQDGDVLTYEADALPVGANFDQETHTFRWVPDFDQSGRYENVKFIVSDGVATIEKTIVITIDNVNRAPQLLTIGNKNVDEGKVLQFSVDAYDPDTSDNLTYTVLNLPSGASFDSVNKIFSWIPDYNQANNYEVTFGVEDNGGLKAQEIVVITVNNVNRVPVIDPISDKTVEVGRSLQFVVTASDPDGDSLNYSIADLPAGAIFNTQTRTFIWSPQGVQVGVHTITVIVSDGFLESSQNVTITVKSDKTAPTITNKTLSPQRTKRRLLFRAKVIDVSGVDSVILRLYGKGRWRDYYMTIDPNTGFSNISVEGVRTSQIVSYKFIAKDTYANQTSTGVFYLTVN